MKSLMQRVLLILGSASALLVLFHWVENWRGQRAWQAWQSELKSRGYQAEPVSYMPSAIPDDENFAAAPRIALALKGTHPLLRLSADYPMEWRVGSWANAHPANLDILREVFPDRNLRKGLEHYREVLDDIVQAARRPSCRLPVDDSRFPYYTVGRIQGLTQAADLLQIRALLALRDGRPEAAFQDVSALLQIVHHLEKEPLLLYHFSFMAMASRVMQPIWEGIETHAWTDSQLTTLEGLLAQVDFFEAIHRVWAMEMASMNSYWMKAGAGSPAEWTPYQVSSPDRLPPDSWDVLLRRLSIPTGWVLQNGVRSCRGLQAVLIDPLDAPNRRIDPFRQDAANKAHSRSSRTPYTFLVSRFVSDMAGENLRVAKAQTSFNQARIACGLERYHRTRGSYPDQLSEVVPAAPLDVIGGKPLCYRRSREGGYVLYGLGWNGTDEGGQPPEGRNALREGDWVWLIHGVSDSKREFSR